MLCVREEEWKRPRVRGTSKGMSKCAEAREKRRVRAAARGVEGSARRCPPAALPPSACRTAAGTTAARRCTPCGNSCDGAHSRRSGAITSKRAPTQQ
eukprot:6199284-Pleurochrysis_carterae.AAC.2